MKRNTIIFITLLTIITMLSCSYENTATVTIDTGIRKQAQLSLFDKVLAFFSLAQPLKADPPPQNYNFDALELNVTASDMSTITRRYAIEELYNNYGKITLEVPAGNQRLFTVIAGNSEGEEIYNRIYGGIATVDLSPGQNVDLDIKMGELNNKFYYFYYYVETKTMDTQFYEIEDPTADIVAFKIYQSDDYSYSNETLFAVITQWEKNFDGEGWTITISKELPGLDADPNTKYYRISNVNQYGEGNRIEITEF